MTEIREAHGNEFARLADIFNSARTSAGCFSGKPVDPDGMRALTEGEAVYVAERQHQIAGFVSVWEPDSFIHHLYVLPDFHGQGIGGELLDFCSDRYGPLSLKCEVLNIGARNFYLDRGWIARERGMGADGVWERLYSPTA